MKINIVDETRKHLIGFLKKVLDGEYTQNELESFVISGYQNEVFERIRTMVVEIITAKNRRNKSNSRTLNEDDRKSIEEIVRELERQCV
jgi:hypothetical protein